MQVQNRPVSQCDVALSCQHAMQQRVYAALSWAPRPALTWSCAGTRVQSWRYRALQPALPHLQLGRTMPRHGGERSSATDSTSVPRSSNYDAVRVIRACCAVCNTYRSGNLQGLARTRPRRFVHRLCLQFDKQSVPRTRAPNALLNLQVVPTRTCIAVRMLTAYTRNLSATSLAPAHLKQEQAYTRSTGTLV